MDGSNSPGKEYQFVALSTRATTTFTDKEKIEVELAAKILELGDAAFKSHVKTACHTIKLENYGGNTTMNEVDGKRVVYVGEFDDHYYWMAERIDI
ncbi:hypothetical protein PPTG_22103 [Phytophthora nicotianae INRA-310]|uniref:Uncharacterized protein n=1 Tax=Phytophthora nicotianae (strain INRA-310) TaxID=761204 RepID=W2QSL3_PHYN3|nr:hypothetical protein PPTG_22103 [Phytophthora nicotianae INRA-310]ETN15260.1 hypothetical protein PPTG_22103 [Phytophthora nicotianae INRA-310]